MNQYIITVRGIDYKIEHSNALQAAIKVLSNLGFQYVCEAFKIVEVTKCEL